MSLAEVSARIATIQSRAAALSTMRPAAVARFAGPDFATTLAGLAPRTDLGATAAAAGSVPEPYLDLPGAAGTPGAADGDDIAAWAKRFVGVPYVAGGRSPKGWDCAGFTHWVAEQYGIRIPEVSWQQIKEGSPVTSLAQAKPGDLLFFHEPSGHRRDPSALKVNHVGIYLGDGRMVEAANPRADTRISEVDTRKLVGIRRIAPEGDGVARTPDQVMAASSVGAAAPTASTASTASARSASSTAAVRGSSEQLGPRELVGVLERAGFHGDGLRTAWALAMRESHGRPGALSPVNPNGTRDHGLFQLNDIHVGRAIAAQDLYSADKQAAAVLRMTKGGTDWSSWGLGHSGWAGHLERAQPEFYARINASFRAWYDRFPA